MRTEVGVPRCVPVEKTARRATTDASCGSSTRGFLSERSKEGEGTLTHIGTARYERHVLLTSRTGTWPAFAASRI